MQKEHVAVEVVLADLISVFEFKKLLDSNKKVAILDVREDEELNYSKLEPSLHIPLMLLEENLQKWRDFSRDAEYKIVLCRIGGRSQKAADYLSNVLGSPHLNLDGGINKYAQEIDNSLETY